MIILINSLSITGLVNATPMGVELNALLLLTGVLIPLIFGFILLSLGRISERSCRICGSVGFIVPAMISVWLWLHYTMNYQGDYAYYLDIDTGLSFLGISLKVGLNGISVVLYLLAGLIGLSAGFYALQGKIERHRQYLALLLIMQGGLMCIFASVDILFFYFFHEIALIPTFVMIAIWGGKGRKVAAMEMTIYLTLGALLSLIGLIALCLEFGIGFSMIDLKNSMPTLLSKARSMTAIAGMILFGFGILVSLFPFHSWAPRGYGAAPTSVAMLHAGVLKKFGLYGLIQITLPLLPHAFSSWTPILLWLALGNVIIIGLITISQQDLKQMIGYSSVMHMGYAFLGLVSMSIIGIGGAVMMLFAHGLSVALLFMLASCIHHRTKTFDMLAMGGLGKKAPVLAALFGSAILASIGLPGFANFWGELSIFLSLWDYSHWVTVAAVSGIVISAIYGLRAVARIFMGQPSNAMTEVEGEGLIQDIQMNERLPALILLLALLLIGFWPRSISDGIDAGVNQQLSFYGSNLEQGEKTTQLVGSTDVLFSDETLKNTEMREGDIDD